MGIIYAGWFLGYQIKKIYGISWSNIGCDMPYFYVQIYKNVLNPRIKDYQKTQNPA